MSVSTPPSPEEGAFALVSSETEILDLLSDGRIVDFGGNVFVIVAEKLGIEKETAEWLLRKLKDDGKVQLIVLKGVACTEARLNPDYQHQKGLALQRPIQPTRSPEPQPSSSDPQQLITRALEKHGPMIDLSGFVPRMLAMELGLERETVVLCVKELVAQGVMARPIIQGKRTYEYRLIGQETAYQRAAAERARIGRRRHTTSDSSSNEQLDEVERRIQKTVRLGAELKKVLDLVKDKPFVDLGGRVTAKVADITGASKSITAYRFRRLVELGFLAEPLRRGPLTFEIRRIDQESIYQAQVSAISTTSNGVNDAPTKKVGRRIATVLAADITARRMARIWHDRFVVGAINVVAGSPGLGKSTLTALIAAELSAQGHPILLSNLEDDAFTVTRPRLDAAGADLSKIQILPAEAAPTLPDDIDSLEQLIRESEIDCLIVDPFGAYFKTVMGMHKRTILNRLSAMARDTSCTVVAVHHTVSKPSDGTALSLIGGPQSGLAGAARAVYLYGFDPDDRDRRALSTVKVNGFDPPATLVFEHDTVELRSGRILVEAGILKLRRQSNAEALQSRRPGLRNRQHEAECAEWLTEFLAGVDEFQRPIAQVRLEGRALGFSWQMIQRTAVELGLETLKVELDENDQFDVWVLPEEHPRRQPQEVRETEEEG